MYIDLFKNYIECGYSKSSGRESCQNVILCQGRSIRECTERVQEMCQHCTEALGKKYRMNGLDLSDRGDNIVLGEKESEVEERPLKERRAEVEIIPT